MIDKAAILDVYRLDRPAVEVDLKHEVVGTLMFFVDSSTYSDGLCTDITIFGHMIPALHRSMGPTEYLATSRRQEKSLLPCRVM